LNGENQVNGSGGFLRILVTGGAGFIGSNYVRMLVDGRLGGNFEKVTVIDDLTYAGKVINLNPISNDPRYEFVKGNICDPILMHALLGSHDAVINFAAESHVDRSIVGARDFFETNLMGVQNILELMTSKRNITMVQVSTDEVYGSILKGSWTEDYPLIPNSPYSASKAAADLAVHAYVRTHDLDVRVTRCSNNYGYYQDLEKVIPRFITNILKGNKVPIYGEGNNRREWIHVDDHCRAVHLVLTEGISGAVYNVPGGTELSNLDLARRILTYMNHGEEYIEFVPDRKGHDFRYSINGRKLINELGFEPKVSFNYGLEKTIEWYRKNTNWWNPTR
jgi:dTDP-glucose 4,6-dehydratase